MIILIFFANLSEERPINGGKEVKPSGFGAIIQTEQSKSTTTTTSKSRYNREFLSQILWHMGSSGQ